MKYNDQEHMVWSDSYFKVLSNAMCVSKHSENQVLPILC